MLMSSGRVTREQVIQCEVLTYKEAVVFCGARPTDGAVEWLCPHTGAAYMDHLGVESWTEIGSTTWASGDTTDILLAIGKTNLRDVLYASSGDEYKPEVGFFLHIKVVNKKNQNER